jgi:hypothetical protein
MDFINSFPLLVKNTIAIKIKVGTSAKANFGGIVEVSV